MLLIIKFSRESIRIIIVIAIISAKENFNEDLSLIILDIILLLQATISFFYIS